MTIGENFQAIVAQRAQPLCAKYRLTQVAKDDWSARFENDKVFFTLTHDHRDHSVYAKLGLRAKHAEIGEFFTDGEVRHFYRRKESGILPQPGGRFLIEPQVEEIVELMLEVGGNLFAGNADEFLRLHYFASGWRSHYTYMASIPRTASNPRPTLGAHTRWLVVGLIAGAAIVQFRLWELILRAAGL